MHLYITFFGSRRPRVQISPPRPFSPNVYRGETNVKRFLRGKIPSVKPLYFDRNYLKLMQFLEREIAMRMPKLQFHKASKRYFVWDGKAKKNFYLGRNEREAKIKYHEMMLDWEYNGNYLVEPLDPETPGGNVYYVAELVEKYSNDRKRYFKNNIKSWDTGHMAMDYLLDNCGHLLVTQFTMKELRYIRDQMMKPTKRNRLLCRNTINRLMREIALFWRWCASMEFVEIDMYHKCQSLQPLRRGHCDVPESEPVQPVELEHVRAVQANTNDSVAALIELQLLTGARPGELVGLKADDINKDVDPWEVRLARHKNAHRGKSRVLYLGPQAQAVLKPFFLKRKPGEYLFSPKDFLEKKREEATTPRRPDQIPDLPMTDRKVGNCYSVNTYRKAIQYACDHAGIPKWHPHQLRHTAATELRKQYGVEVARAVLGHSNLSATEIYAEVDATIAAKVAKERG